MADSEPPVEPQASEAAPPEKSFWDSWAALGLLIAAILLGRFYVLEPFKIPSGSMEPTLFGHEDHGDRILTNKLAYADPKNVQIVMLGAFFIIVGAAALSIIYSNRKTRGRIARTIGVCILLLVFVVGGIGYQWSKSAVAGEPKRFDVVVFEYENTWEYTVKAKTQKINYIKRLIGRPGERITLSDGDLFLREGGKDQIIRKWETGEDLQETLWYPVSKAWETGVHKDLSGEDWQKLAFPWDGAGEDSGAKVEPKGLSVGGEKNVVLNYKHQVSNIYLKQGRWPFIHDGCPEANKTLAGGAVRDPNSKSEHVTAYVTNTWDGVRCPNCGQLMFPCRRIGDKGIRPGETIIQPEANSKFFYGGTYTVGDLKLEIDLDVEQAGSTIQLRAGNTLNHAYWSIPPAEQIGDGPSGIERPVEGKTDSLAVGKHSLMLAYVDGTVIASLDGNEVARQKIDIAPRTSNTAQVFSLARVALSKFKGRITKLNLSRDLYYQPGEFIPIKGAKGVVHFGDTALQATVLDLNDTQVKLSIERPGIEGKTEAKFTTEWVPINQFIADERPRQQTLRNKDESTGNYWFLIPDNHYLMLGDNSPSSADGRSWGFVPKDHLIGRAGVVWWPPSRWRMIR